MAPAFDTKAYFALRAPRYSSALDGCPRARVLDTLPYMAAMRAAGLECKRGLRVLDAFGGNGFLPRYFAPAGFSFTVVDLVPEMLAGIPSNLGVRTRTTADDFRGILAEFGEGSFDLVVTHGGLHHAVDSGDGGVLADSTRARQDGIVTRLASLVAPGGALVLADIPRVAPEVLVGPIMGANLNPSVMAGLIGKAAAEEIALVVGMKGGLSLRDIASRIEERRWAPVSFPVPARFFDEFVTKEAPMGHVALYSDFDRLDAAARAVGLERMGRLNFHGPWVFSSGAEAGWFFKEKFSIGEAAPIGGDIKADLAMLEKLGHYLGVNAQADRVAVNWGVTYAAYTKPRAR